MFGILVLLAGLAVLAQSGPGSGAWLDVPFVRQEKNGCGTASIAMVMQYWSKNQGSEGSRPVRMPGNAQKIYSEGQGGIPASEMERYFRAQGFRTFVFQGNWADLYQHLSAGRPLIVSVKEGARKSSLHYLVVVGVHPDPDTVLVNDPARKKLLKTTRVDFESRWKAADYWTLLVLPQNGR